MTYFVYATQEYFDIWKAQLSSPRAAAWMQPTHSPVAFILTI